MQRKSRQGDESRDHITTWYLVNSWAIVWSPGMTAMMAATKLPYRCIPLLGQGGSIPRSPRPFSEKMEIQRCGQWLNLNNIYLKIRVYLDLCLSCKPFLPTTMVGANWQGRLELSEITVSLENWTCSIWTHLAQLINCCLVNCHPISWNIGDPGTTTNKSQRCV